jgi:hypothetical protein
LKIYSLIEHNYAQSVIDNFESELNFWKHYNVVKIIILMIVMARIITQKFIFLIMFLFIYDNYFHVNLKIRWKN